MPSRKAGIAISLTAVTLALALCTPVAAAKPVPKTYRSPAEIIKTSSDGEWQALDPQNTLVMEVGGKQVVIALAPRFAPEHAANIRMLAHEGYWDGTDVIRVQDDYVTQWGDPNEDDKDKAKPLGSAKPHLPAEFSIAAKGLPIALIHDKDGWAPQTGFVDGMPAAFDPKLNRAWIPHCYGVVGAGRGDVTDSSTGTSLYTVIGQSPRPLDLNITVVGRVVQGMEALSALPRGTGQLGFYEHPSEYVPIQSTKLLADIPEAQRPKLETLRTDSASFKEIVESRRHATNKWFVHSPEYSNVCNITVPVRPVER